MNGYGQFCPVTKAMELLDEGGDVCDFDPGHPVRARVETDLRTLIDVWRGERGWNDALRADELTVHGTQQVRRAVPHWLSQSPLASVPRPV